MTIGSDEGLATASIDAAPTHVTNRTRPGTNARFQRCEVVMGNTPEPGPIPEREHLARGSLRGRERRVKTPNAPLHRTFTTRPRATHTRGGAVSGWTS